MDLFLNWYNIVEMLTRQLPRPSRSPPVWTIDEFDIHQINKAPEIKSTVILIAESLKVALKE